MSRTNRRIAVDLDDVLFDFIGEFFEWHNELHGTALDPNETVFDKLWEAWSGTKEEASERVPRFFQELDMLSVAPMEGAVQAIRWLKQSCSLCIVSARDPGSQEVTNQWLAKYFPGAFEEVILGVGNPMADGQPLSKTDVCMQLGARLLIDDQLVHAIEAEEAGIPVLLFGHRPWNRVGELPSNVRRVEGWPQVRAILEDGDWLNLPPA